MWLDWLFSCDCGFQSICPLMEKDKRLMKASLWDRLTDGGKWVLFWWAMLRKLLIQFSVDGWSFFPTPAIYLGPNYDGGNEDNGELPQKIPCMYCYSPCPQPCSRPPLTHAFAGDSQTSTGKSRTVSCGITVPFSWVLVHSVLLCPPRAYFPILCNGNINRLYFEGLQNHCRQ